MATIPQFGQAAGGVIGGISSFIQGQATASADQAQAKGFGQEASLYNQAAGVAGENIVISQQSTQLQQYFSMRQLQQTQATDVAQIAGGNFQMGATGQALLAENARMGGVASAVLGQQGAIQVNAYQLQKYALTAEADKATADQKAAQDAASAASSGAILGLIGGIAQGAAALF